MSQPKKPLLYTSSKRYSLASLLVLSVLSIALLAYAFFLAYRHDEQQATAKNQVQIELLTLQVQNLLSTVDVGLDILARDKNLSVNDSYTEEEQEQEQEYNALIKERLNLAHALMPNVAALSLANMQGEIIASTKARLIDSSIAQQDFFKTLNNNRQTRLFSGYIDVGTQHFLLLARPIYSDTGHISKVALAYVDTQKIRTMPMELNLGIREEALIVDTQKTGIIAKQSTWEVPNTMLFALERLMKTQTQQASGHFKVDLGSGEKSLVNFKKLTQAPLLIAVMQSSHNGLFMESAALLLAAVSILLLLICCFVIVWRMYGQSRHNAKQADMLYRKTMLLQTILNECPAAIHLLDAQGQTLLQNRSSMQMPGLKPDAKKLRELIQDKAHKTSAQNKTIFNNSLPDHIQPYYRVLKDRSGEPGLLQFLVAPEVFKQGQNQVQKKSSGRALEKNIPPVEDSTNKNTASTSTNRFPDLLALPDTFLPIEDEILTLPQETPKNEVLSFSEVRKMPELTRLNDTQSAQTLPIKDALDGVRILLVDDNFITRQTACSMLRQLGGTVEIAHDGAKALEFLRVQQFDMVLMDLIMADMDGFTATRYIRSGIAGEQVMRIPVVAFSVSANTQQEKSACVESGMDDYISKTTDLYGMAKVIQNCLEKQKKQEQSELKQSQSNLDQPGAPEYVTQQKTKAREVCDQSVFDELRQQNIVFDAQALMALCSHNRETATMILQPTLKYMDGYWEFLSDAMQSGVLATAAFWAHTLRVQIGQSGGVRVEKMLEYLEQDLQSNCIPDKLLLDQLSIELQAFSEAAQAHLKEL